MRKSLFILAIIILFVLAFVPEAQAQCSQCKLLAEQSGNGIDAEILGNDGGNTINSAIIYIMVVPYLILSIMFRKQIKRFFQRTFTKNS